MAKDDKSDQTQQAGSARSSRSKAENQDQTAAEAGRQGQSFQYSPSDEQSPPIPNQPTALPPQQPVSWTASEYVQRHKNIGWYLLALIGIVVLTILIYLLTRDVVSSVALGIVGLAFAAFAGRPPRVIQYSVDNSGVHVGQKYYSYDQFSSFSVMVEGGVRSIMLMPVKRFGLPLVIHYEPADEGKIAAILGSHLPHEDREVPAVDRLMTKIHF